MRFGPVARAVALALIRAYRVLISPLRPSTCRFLPTCSEYAYEAFSRFGFWTGLWFTARRLVRCGPWHPGGHDPLPDDRTEQRGSA